MAEPETKVEAEPWVYDGPLSITITFEKPLKFTDKDPNPVAEITLTEPLVEHYSAFTDCMNKTKNEFEAGALMISKNTGVQLGLIKKMTGRDFEKAQAFFTGFTTPPPKSETGDA